VDEISRIRPAAAYNTSRAVKSHIGSIFGILLMIDRTIRTCAGLTLTAALLIGAAACSQDSADEALLERGEYLVNGIVACGNCHSSRTPEGELIDGMELGGNFVIEEPGFRAYAPNITPDTRTGIGSWTDTEIIRAVREGIRPDGRVLGPPMAFQLYRDISDNDIRAIVAYLRNVPAIENVVPRSTYTIELPPNWGPPLGVVPDVPRDDIVAYGAYLAGPLGHCTHCHTPLVKGQFDFSRIGAGGNLFQKPLGFSFTTISSNITQHPQLGVGEWSDDEIRRAITTGVSRNGRQLLPFMGFPFYARMSDEDLAAMVAYMRTIPPSTAEPPSTESD
jgi:mono/diheme cytochrome c family protein